MNTELWKDIDGYANLYKISNFGNIYSYATKRQVGCFTGDYPRVSLRKDGKLVIRYIHQLVWEMFGEGQRDGMNIVVDHIDDDAYNNRIDNLQLMSNKDNVKKRHNYAKKMIMIAKDAIKKEKQQGYWERKLIEVLA